jgi:predicted Zn-ribbon and HTH transcriptional regulator
MPSKRRGELPEIKPAVCPECGHANTPAEIIRLDAKRIQCAACKQAFSVAIVRPLSTS